jgi:hypothetical protein
MPIQISNIKRGNKSTSKVSDSPALLDREVDLLFGQCTTSAILMEQALRCADALKADLKRKSHVSVQAEPKKVNLLMMKEYT